MGKRVLLCLAHMSGKEMDFIKEAFDDNWVVPLGPNVDGFEEDLRKFLSASFCNKDTHQKYNSSTEKLYGLLNPQVAALSSGTAAVHLALIGCGVQPGDEVMV